eukprot:m.217313 g.217313  ORF g.217313 m.217313 type:complete len:73 (+) comp19121_c0_seq3:1394-1612(+)
MKDSMVNNVSKQMHRTESVVRRIKESRAFYCRGTLESNNLGKLHDASIKVATLARAPESIKQPLDAPLMRTM